MRFMLTAIQTYMFHADRESNMPKFCHHVSHTCCMSRVWYVSNTYTELDLEFHAS